MLIALNFPCWRASSLVSWYCSMQMIALYFPCWRSSSRVSWYCYMRMIALNFPCWRAYSLVSYIVTCRWLLYAFPAEELIHLYHILLNADDCLILSPLKIFFTCIIYCYMQMIALYFPCWGAYSLACWHNWSMQYGWYWTFPADDNSITAMDGIGFVAHNCLLLSLLMSYWVSCIIYWYRYWWYWVSWHNWSQVWMLIGCMLKKLIRYGWYWVCWHSWSGMNGIVFVGYWVCWMLLVLLT